MLLLSIQTTNVFAGKPVIYLDQGWTQQQRQTFYETPQGSYLIPLKWYLSLEQPDDDKLFSRRNHIEKFNYLIMTETDGNVIGLPLGFAIEPLDNGENWVGYTCAACHTNEIK